MRRALAFAIVLGLAYATRRLGDDGVPLRGAGLALGFALIAAALAGSFVERVGLPRLTGYLTFGLVCGPYLGDIISRSMARQLQLVNGVAIALIAFVAGLELNLARLRPRLRTIAEMGGATLALL